MRLKSGKETKMSVTYSPPTSRYNTQSDLSGATGSLFSPLVTSNRNGRDKSDMKLSRSNSADNIFTENTNNNAQPGLNTSQLGQSMLQTMNTHEEDTNANAPWGGIHDQINDARRTGTQYQQGQGAYPSLQHQIASLQNSSRLAFISSDEIRKFKGNKRLGEHLFSPGPTFEEFLNTFLVFCNRHGLHTDEDRITALRLNVDQNQGDASVILASALDSNLNKTNISFNDLTSYLSEIYRPIANLNLCRAAAGFTSKLNTKLEDGAGNPIEQLRQLELSAKELVKTFLSRPNFHLNTKSTEDTCLELLILTAYSSFVGEKLSNKVLENLPPNLPPRDIFSKVHNEIRKTFTENAHKIATLEQQHIATEPRRGRPRFETRPEPRGPNNRVVGFRERSKSTSASQQNHKVKYFCSHCRISGHSFSHCRRRPQDDRTRPYCTFCQLAGHSVDVCRKRKFRTGDVSGLPVHKNRY